ncbi:MAG: efflux RND transporter periplasmic adaptor subunit [Planctomycetaceae bacterium]|nr:efflux RND transporter periplasmic adaptor subunit [Planctomycetaceae bacterium]
MESLNNRLSQTATLLCWGVLALTLTGCTHPTTDKEAHETQKSIPVKTVVVVQQDVVRTTTQPATVHAYYRAEVRAKVSGYIKTVEADIGDVVEQEAPLAVINVPELEKQRQVIDARISRYEAEENQAMTGVELAVANVQSAEARLAQATSELKRAEASLAAAEAEFDRTSDLVERQSLERRVLDEVRKKRDSEIANKEAVASAIASAQADVTVAKAKLSSAEADMQAAQAATTIARRQGEETDVLIEYAKLTAPFAGIVTARSVDPGDLVREASEVGTGEPLFVISQVDTVRVHIPVPEVDAALVSRGDAVELRFPSFPEEEPINAAVTRLSEDLDPSTRTMLVEVELQNPKRKLIPGMFGQATITLSTKIATNMLPARAVRFDETGKAYVYIVGEEETVTISEVTTGIDNGESIEIQSGVQPGQQVVDAHLKRFTTGQKVSVINN